MRRLVLATLIAAAAAPLAVAAPAVAQSRAEEQRFDAAQQRFDREYQVYQDAVQRYRASRGGAGYNGYPQGGPGYPQGSNGYPQGSNGYPQGGPGAYNDDRYENGYDPARYYRSGSNYQARTLSTDDRVYAGNDGRYYCKRSDGTTGLIVGAAGGGILGNVIDGGHSRGVGTLLGGAIGALAGRAVERSNSNVQCQ